MTKRTGIEVALLAVALANPAYAGKTAPATSAQQQKADASPAKSSKGKPGGLIGFAERAVQRAVTRVKASFSPVHVEQGFAPAYVLRDVIRNSKKSGDPTVAKNARDSLRDELALSQTRQKGKTGDIWSHKFPKAKDSTLNRQTYDANNTENLPGTLELTETDKDTKVDSAKRGHEALAVFYDLNKKLGFDAMKVATNGALQMTVRYGQAYDNAYYDGQRMVVGSGDPNGLFKDLTLGPDVSYHEIGHGMTEHALGNASASIKALRHDGFINRRQAIGMWLSAKAHQITRAFRNHVGVGLSTSDILNYQGQSGALNESISDIYGAMGLQYMKNAKLGQLKEEDFLIGHGIMNDSIKNDAGHPVALRNMLHPGTAYNDPRMGKDRQPADMAHLYTGSADHGGVHINSGIPSRAWAVATTELAKTMPDKTTWETTGYVWMHSVALLGPNATFQECAQATYKTAQKLFPQNPDVAAAIKTGWQTVGLSVDGAAPASTSLRRIRAPRS